LQRACRGPTFRTRRCPCRLGAGPHKVSLYRRSLGLLRGVAAAGAASWASGTFAASARQRSPRCRCQSPGAPKTPAPPAARSACPGSWPRRRNLRPRRCGTVKLVEKMLPTVADGGEACSHIQCVP
ncbi:unnamed protein product, partial [Ixodes pacificus]